MMVIKIYILQGYVPQVNISECTVPPCHSSEKHVTLNETDKKDPLTICLKNRPAVMTDKSSERESNLQNAMEKIRQCNDATFCHPLLTLMPFQS